MQFDIFLTIILLLVVLYIGYLTGKYISKKEHEDQIPEIRETAIKQSRAVLSGQFSEQISPYLPDFPYKPTEVRFLGKPIDFVVFKGMDEKKVDEIVFLEVKTGKNDLNSIQRELKKAVENRNIRWDEYRINDK